MKKWIALLLALLMVFSLAACGSSGSSSSGSRSSGSSSSGSSKKKTNSYTSPVSFMEKYDNAKKVVFIKLVDEAYNGVDGGNMAKILKIMAKSDDFKEFIEDFEEGWVEDYEDKVDEFGKNFKISYKNDKEMEEKLDRDELQDYKASIKLMGDDILDMVDEFKEMDKDEQKDVAEDMGLSYSDLKDMVEYMEALGRELKSATVDEGYELEVIKTTTGKELDEPEEDEVDIIVLKVNGRWINYDVFRSFSLNSIF